MEIYVRGIIDLVLPEQKRFTCQRHFLPYFSTKTKARRSILR